VRLIVAESLQKIHTDEAFDALASSLDQPDTRVRKQVITGIGQFYRPQARDILMAIAQVESNPGIASAALGNLGRFNDPNIPPILIEALQSDSYMDMRAMAAVTSLGKLKDPTHVPALIELITTRQNEYSSRGFGSLLSTMAQCARDMEDTSEARNTLLTLVNHPRQSIRIGAIRALGTLGDEKAAPVLETLAGKQRQVNGQIDLVQLAAQAALETLGRTTPVVPDEVMALRKSVKTLEDSNAKLERKLNDLEARLDAMKDTD
jgi:aminopeptidase N